MVQNHRNTNIKTINLPLYTGDELQPYEIINKYITIFCLNLYI